MWGGLLGLAGLAGLAGEELAGRWCDVVTACDDDCTRQQRRVHT